MEKENWERFWASGRIEDYLLYAGMATEKPESSAADLTPTPGDVRENVQTKMEKGKEKGPTFT